jgi:hypothetical protein
MIPISARVTPKDPFMANLHGVGFVHEVWGESKIEHFYQEITEKHKTNKNEVWYRVVFDNEYHEDPDEYDENGDLLSCGSDNAITFAEDELEILPCLS